MGNMPDVTKNQIIGLLVGGIPVLGNLLRAFGVIDLSEDQSEALKQTVIWAGGAGGILIAADAYLRSNRAKALASIKAAAFGPSEPPQVSDVSVAEGSVVLTPVVKNPVEDFAIAAEIDGEFDREPVDNGERPDEPFEDRDLHDGGLT